MNFAMSRYTGAPSMLFEMGFMCNPAEYELLINADYLDNMGIALGKSIEKYLLSAAEISGKFNEAEVLDVNAESAVQDNNENEAEPKPRAEDSSIIGISVALSGAQETEQAYKSAYIFDNSNEFNKTLTKFGGVVIGVLLAGTAMFFPNRRKNIK